MSYLLKLRFVLLAVMLMAFSLTVFAAEKAGIVLKSTGKSQIVSLEGESRVLKSKSAIFVGDKVLTGSGAQVFIRMLDKTKMIVRENSEVLIAEFEYKKEKNDKHKTSLLKGALRAISGEIGKRSAKNVEYVAGTATIGIRGTDIDVAIIVDGQTDRAGVYNFVRDGMTEVALATGETVLVEKDKAGFIPKTPRPGEPLLQVLDDRPAFLSGSGFDTLMQQLTNPRVPAIR